MPKDALPSQKTKQQLLFAKEKNEKLLSEYGRKYVQAGWLCDAVDFFARAGDQEGLQGVRQLAREQGDIFLLRRCLNELHLVPEEAEFKELGERAFELGKLQFAREAFRIAGDRKAMDRVHALISPLPDQNLTAPEAKDGSETQQ